MNHLSTADINSYMITITYNITRKCLCHTSYCLSTCPLRFTDTWKTDSNCRMCCLHHTGTVKSSCCRSSPYIWDAKISISNIDDRLSYACISYRRSHRLLWLLRLFWLLWDLWYTWCLPYTTCCIPRTTLRWCHTCISIVILSGTSNIS